LQLAAQEAGVIALNWAMMAASVVAVEKRRGVGLSATAPVKRVA
jgi:hypothetical protein